MFSKLSHHLVTFSLGYGVYKTENSFVKTSTPPKTGYMTIIEDFNRLELEKIIENGDRVVLLAVNPWCEEPFVRVFEEVAVTVHSLPDWVVGERTRLMLLDTAFAEGHFLKESFDVNQEAQCSTLIQIDRKNLNVADLSSHFLSENQLRDSLLKELLRQNQTQVSRFTALKDLEPLRSLPSLLVFTSFSTQASPHPLQTNNFCLDHFNRQRQTEMIPYIVELLLESPPTESVKNAYLLERGTLAAEYEASDCHQLLLDVQRTESKLQDKKGSEAREAEKPTPQVILYTGSACAVCTAYEVLLDHLMREEHEGVAYEKVIKFGCQEQRQPTPMQQYDLDRDCLDGSQVPVLVINDAVFDLETELNSVVKAREVLSTHLGL